MNYNNKKFRPISCSENGEVSTETIFEYKQEGTILTCTYSDSNILKGHLIGKVDIHGNIEMRYHQINNKNELMTGICHATPEILPDGKIRLHEKWQWTSGDFSKGISVLQEL